MPFRLRLKCKQRYNVASKSVYVLSVELLDNALLECTLTWDSSGREALNNVTRRLNLSQSHFMGLRYVSRKSKIRWVDLDRPLKKQLDKYASEPYLYLGVMFYVTDVSLLDDPITRYHFFLQLKLDVIEGRLRCNYEQAVVLASYSLQAEFGDHDSEKHTSDYLQGFPLLPKPMMSQFGDRMESLTDAIIHQHASLRGIARQLAEVYYIVGAQQLEGYGQDCFLAKDESGNEVLLGASLTGIVVRKGNGQSPSFFRWNDITNLVNHKRFFGIECQNYEYSSQFVLDEAESAKYVWKMCVLQHSFFKRHMCNGEESNELNITLDGEILSHVNSSTHSRVSSSLNESLRQKGTQRHLTDLCSMNDIDSECRHLSSYRRPVPDYETAVKNKVILSQYKHPSSFHIPHNNNNNSNINNNHNNRRRIMYTSHPTLMIDSHQSSRAYYCEQIAAAVESRQKYFKEQQQVYSSTPELSGVVFASSYEDNDSTQEKIVAELQRLNLYKAPPPYSATKISSNSTPDLASLFPAGSSPDLVSRRNLGHKHYSSRNEVSSYPSKIILTKHTNNISSNNNNNNTNSSTNNNNNNISSNSKTNNNIETIVSEPIYQNQEQIKAELEKSEPIYQNLIPNSVSVRQEEEEEEIQIDNTVSSGPCISRISITNSREDLHHSILKNNTSILRSSCNDSSLLSVTSNGDEVGQQVVGNKHRGGGRKRWGWNFGNNNKTGSLKSIKSEGGNKEDKIGPLMLAAYHGLTRSRPDLLQTTSPSPPTFSSPARMPKDEIGAYLTFKLTEGDVVREFEQIPKKKANSNFTISTLKENICRNRFEDVLPYDENRVKIPSSKDNLHGYINASHMSVTLGCKERFYIAAQSPLPNTVHAFWQLIYQTNVHLIVMLTDISSGSTVNNIPYWPLFNGSLLELGEFTILRKSRSESDKGSYITSSLQLVHTPSKTLRSVWHIQYSDWSDNGCPSNIKKYLEFIEEMRVIRRHSTESKKRNSPVLIHCSAGVGRTGVTILTDILLYCVDYNIDVDIPKVVTHLRQQRMLMIQTVAQFKFVHAVLIDYLKQSRLI